MQMCDTNMIWQQNREAAYNTAGRCYPAFLPDGSAERLERIRQGQLLFDGLHEIYYLREGRTQGDFPTRQANGVDLTPYSTFNLLGLCSLKFADLLFNELPKLTVDDPIQQQWLNALVKRCNLQSLLHSACTDCSYEAESFLESVILDDGKAYLRQVPTPQMFPEGDMRPDWQFPSYLRMRVANAGTPDEPVWLLLETRYGIGNITRTCTLLDDAGKRGREVSLSAWPEPGLQPVTRTGITQNTITYVPNVIVRGFCRSDYDGCINLQDSLNIKDTQIDNILAKHADPAVAVPVELFDQLGRMSARNKLLSYNDPERIAKYIVRDMQLDSCMQGISRTTANLMIRIEMSPVLLGLREGAVVDAWRKLKLTSVNTLWKGKRKESYWTAGVTRGVEVTQELENTIPGVRYNRYPIGVKIQGGIPDDPTEVATEISTLRGAGVMSRRRAVSEQLHDPVATQAELDEIESEEKAKAKVEAPDIIMSMDEGIDEAPQADAAA